MLPVFHLLVPVTDEVLITLSIVLRIVISHNIHVCTVVIFLIIFAVTNS